MGLASNPAKPPQVLKYVTIRPPPLPVGVFGRLFGWIVPVLTTSDVWLLHSAGLDALVLQKTQALCLQIFLPVAIVGCCLCGYSGWGTRVGMRGLHAAHAHPLPDARAPACLLVCRAHATLVLAHAAAHTRLCTQPLLRNSLARAPHSDATAVVGGGRARRQHVQPADDGECTYGQQCDVGPLVRPGPELGLHALLPAGGSWPTHSLPCGRLRAPTASGHAAHLMARAMTAFSLVSAASLMHRVCTLGFLAWTLLLLEWWVDAPARYASLAGLHSIMCLCVCVYV